MPQGNNIGTTKRRQYACIIVALVFVLIIPIWLIWIAPTLLKIPDHFTYQAELLSLDNFYDEKEHKFEGEEISKTMFKYNVINKTANYLEINNSFIARKFNNQLIFSVSRHYFINAKTGEHVAIPGQENRIGYLFAPRFASKDGFYYWHVNYDAPAYLQFIDKEKLEGLTVYHFQAQYEANQTASLHNLPGVPDKRGVRTAINLQIWIEPISGWLIKYHDNTLAYFYDMKTGKKLMPWNHFSNQYTDNSIRDQIKKAEQLKWKILLLDFGATSLFALAAISLLIYAFTTKLIKLNIERNARLIAIKNILKKQGFLLLILFVLLISSVELIYFFWQVKPTMFTIGIATWQNNEDTLDEVRGFKDELTRQHYYEGKNIKFLIRNSGGNIDNQINLIESFLRAKSSLLFTLSATGTMVAKGITNRTPIIFSDVAYPVETNIVTALKSCKGNIVGIRNYIPAALQFYYFEQLFPNTQKLGFVHRRGEPNSEVQYAEFKRVMALRNINIVDISAIDLDDLNQQLQNQSHLSAIYLACDDLADNNGDKAVAAYGIKNKIPTFSCNKSSVEKGILMGYFADPYTLGKLAGEKAGLILKGADTDWLRTEAPGQGYLMINAMTARQLGISISNDMRKQANLIIEK